MKPNETADLGADNIHEQNAEDLSQPKPIPLSIEESKPGERHISKDGMPAPFYDELHFANYE